MDMKRILQAMDGVSTKPVEGANDMKKFLQVVTEGANPHKVTLPVQMAMQHYQSTDAGTIKEKVEPKRPVLTSNLFKYYEEAQQEILDEEESKKEFISEQARSIANRVLMKESPIAMDTANPNDPLIHSHEKANPAKLSERIQRARAQLKELAQMAESNDLVVWEKITRLSKGGMFMGLEQNLEQVRHGIMELAHARKTGQGVSGKVRGQIDKNIG